MKSKKGDITWDKIVVLILAVVAVLLIGWMIYGYKDQIYELLTTLRNILRFK